VTIDYFYRKYTGAKHNLTQKILLTALQCDKLAVPEKSRSFLRFAVGNLQQVAVYHFDIVSPRWQDREAEYIGGFAAYIFSGSNAWCVRACAISVRLPSPRALTGDIYVNSKLGTS